MARVIVLWIALIVVAVDLCDPHAPFVTDPYKVVSFKAEFPDFDAPFIHSFNLFNNQTRPIGRDGTPVRSFAHFGMFYVSVMTFQFCPKLIKVAEIFTQKPGTPKVVWINLPKRPPIA